jgi:hypothetical protein
MAAVGRNKTERVIGKKNNFPVNSAERKVGLRTSDAKNRVREVVLERNPLKEKSNLSRFPKKLRNKRS